MNNCCKSETNLFVAETRGDVVVRKCKECDKRHIELTLDPGKFGITLKGL